MKTFVMKGRQHFNNVRGECHTKKGGGMDNYDVCNLLANLA